jgi:hypothetical protein
MIKSSEAIKKGAVEAVILNLLQQFFPAEVIL